MHWFWRATIAVGLSIAAGGLLGKLGIQNEPFGEVLMVVGITAFISVLIYAALTRHFHPKRDFLDGETRCRKCGYILKGIPEPRCSECGERI